MDRRMFALPAAALMLVSCVSGPPVSPTPPSAQATVAPSTSAPTAPPATVRPTAPARELLLGSQPLVPCALGLVSARCGSLTVPENPAQPAGRTIDLRVAVVPAAAPEPEPDPVFMLAGGPGGAATESMAWTATTFRGIHATRDIVLVDQRGTGASNELWLPNPDDPIDTSPAAIREHLRNWATEAFGALNADASTYTTSVAMNDLDAVRAALGYDRINLYGASYGATAAQYYVRQHPEHVRTVVLDGGTLLDVPVMELIAARSQRALNQLLARCAADAACSAAYPTLRAEWKATLARLARGPVDTGIDDPYGDGTIVLDRNGFAAVAHQALIQSSTSARLPWLIHAAAAGRWDVVGSAIAAVAQPPEPGILVMSGIIRCSEAWGRFDPDETRRLSAGSYFLEAELEMARNQFLACPFAPKGVVPEDDAAPARGSMPVLFVVGGADPQDPPENIADASVDFPNSLVVVVPGEGHTVGHIGCVPAVIDAFVAAGTTGGLDTACVAAMRPPAFQLP